MFVWVTMRFVSDLVPPRDNKSDPENRPVAETHENGKVSGYNPMKVLQTGRLPEGSREIFWDMTLYVADFY